MAPSTVCTLTKKIGKNEISFKICGKGWCENKLLFKIIPQKKPLSLHPINEYVSISIKESCSKQYIETNYKHSRCKGKIKTF